MISSRFLNICFGIIAAIVIGLLIGVCLLALLVVVLEALKVIAEITSIFGCGGGGL